MSTSPERRETLKILGAIGSTCAFPFSADELYGQHAHAVADPAPLPPPVFFTAAELRIVAALAEMIIPATDTPGAIAAGVPAYIDMVCSRNRELGQTIRDGLKAGLTEQDLGRLEAEKSPFFRAFKNLTADGYYTSRAGLIEELGYSGNAVLGEFPVCEIPEH